MIMAENIEFLFYSTQRYTSCICGVNYSFFFLNGMVCYHFLMPELPSWTQQAAQAGWAPWSSYSHLWIESHTHTHFTNHHYTIPANILQSEAFYGFRCKRVPFIWTSVWRASAETHQLSHMTTVDRAIYIQLPVSCLLRGIIWQSDKQRDRQTDKQSVGYSQSSHCQSHYHSVPVSGPTAKGQYLSRQSPSLPNIEQHAVAVCPPSDFWTVSVFYFFFSSCGGFVSPFDLNALLASCKDAFICVTL